MPKVTREHSTTAARKAVMEAPIKKEKPVIKKEKEEEETLINEEPEVKTETKQEENMVYGEILPSDEKQLFDLIKTFPKVIISLDFNMTTLYFILLFICYNDNFFLNHFKKKKKKNPF